MFIYRNYEIHVNKLAKIRSSSNGKSNIGTFDKKRLRTFSEFYNNRDRDFQHAFKSKQSEVDKINGKILDKIVDVNNRKSQSINNKGSIITHKSLSNLKRSMQNIEIENQKIAKKLIETKSDLKQ